MSHLMSLSGVKRTLRFAAHMSAFDPKRTSPKVQLPLVRMFCPKGERVAGLNYRFGGM